MWGSGYNSYTVNLKKDFGQKDVPHHKNTAGSTRNTSISYTRKGKYCPATTSTPPPPSCSGSWDNVEFCEKAAINASAAAAADCTVLEQHSGYHEEIFSMDFTTFFGKSQTLPKQKDNNCWKYLPMVTERTGPQHKLHSSPKYVFFLENALLDIRSCVCTPLA